MMFRSNRLIKKKFFLSLRVFVQLTLSVVVMAAASVIGLSQTASSTSAGTETKPVEKSESNTPNQSGQPNKETKPPFTLRVTEDQIIGITLKAQDATVKEIAAELSKRLRIPIAVTPIIQKHRVTVNFSDLVLEPAMQQLAPQVFIDYEIDTASGKTPRPLGIYLQGYNEPPPAENAVVKGNSDAIIIEGDTEDTGEAKDKDDKEQELKVKYEKGELSVIARKQPLVVVLYAIANELGIPLQVTDEIVDPISVNIQKASVESALQQLSQNIRLYLRADLMTQERRPLRLVLVGRDKKS
jgi:type II secretory pathway component GspD/PulD (secretin)